MPLPVPEGVQSCYDESRAFLKGGAKASNKLYDPTINAEKARSADHRREAGVMLYGLRGYHSSFVMTGQIMRETGNTWANCLESTCLAASFVGEHLPNHPMTVGHAVEGDHGFLIVGSPPPDGITVDGLARMSRQTPSYAVDVWAGICCHSSEYPAQLREKMQAWEQQGKVLIGERIQKKPTEWAGKVYSSTLELLDPWKRALGDNKQQALAFMEKKRMEALSHVPGEEHYLYRVEASLRAEQQLLDQNPNQFLSNRRASITDRLRNIDADLERNDLAAVLRENRLADRASLTESQRRIDDEPQTYLEAAVDAQPVRIESIHRQRLLASRKLDFLTLQTERRQPAVPTQTQQQGPGPWVNATAPPPYAANPHTPHPQSTLGPPGTTAGPSTLPPGGTTARLPRGGSKHGGRS